MAAQSTYTLIATATGNGTSTANITFSNIPQTYTDLVLVTSVLVNSSVGYGYTINTNISGSIYYGTTLQANGSSVAAAQNPGANTVWYPINALSINTSYPTIITTHFLNYANSTAYKSILSRQAGDFNGSGATTEMVGVCYSTSPINSITVGTNNSVYWTTSSTFNLYGIQAA